MSPRGQSSHEISTITAGQGVVVVADIHGQIHLCNPDFDVTRSWLAYDNGRVTHMQFAGTKGVLITIGVGNFIACHCMTFGMAVRY